MSKIWAVDWQAGNDCCNQAWVLKKSLKGTSFICEYALGGLISFGSVKWWRAVLEVGGGTAPIA